MYSKYNVKKPKQTGDDMQDISGLTHLLIRRASIDLPSSGE
jgi:hypothetical protein